MGNRPTVLVFVNSNVEQTYVIYVIDHNQFNHADNNNASNPMQVKLKPTTICAEVTQLVYTKLYL